MKRLIDMEDDGTLFKRGADVIRETPPTPEAPDMRARVWRSLQRTPAAAPRGFRIPALKLATVAIVAFVAGTAGAVVARRWIVPVRSEGVAPIAQATPPRARAEQARPIAPAVPVPAPEAAHETPAPKPAPRSAPHKVAIAPPSATAVARERTEVLDALVALRREHDPVRAGTLLARYLSAHPRGALREEALALAIEAADGRSDGPGATRLAQAYQDEFPGGRFLIFARSHTDGHTSH